MSNAISKAAVAAAMALAFAACSDSDRASADELYRQGEQAVESRNYRCYHSFGYAQQPLSVADRNKAQGACPACQGYGRNSHRQHIGR